MKFTCPSCGKKVPWSQRNRFTRMIVTPNAAPCPFCHASVIPSKTPYRLMWLGIAIAFIPMWLRYAFEVPQAVQYVALALGLILIWTNGPRIKLENSNKDEGR